MMDYSLLSSCYIFFFASSNHWHNGVFSPLACCDARLRASGAIRMETTDLCPVAGLPMSASGRLYIVYGDCSWGNFLTQCVQIFITRGSIQCHDVRPGATDSLFRVAEELILASRLKKFPIFEKFPIF